MPSHRYHAPGVRDARRRDRQDQELGAAAGRRSWCWSSRSSARTSALPPAPWPISACRGCAWSSRATAGPTRAPAGGLRRRPHPRRRPCCSTTLEAAIADCTLVLATTARAHDQAKPVIDAREAARGWRRASRRRDGRDPVRPRAQRARERGGRARRPHRHVAGQSRPSPRSISRRRCWSSPTSGSSSRPAARCRSPCRRNRRRRRSSSSRFFATLERELEKVEFFRPPDKRATMLINLRNIFTRMQPTQQDIQTLHGVIMAIAEGRKGPAQRRRARRRARPRRCARCSPSTAEGRVPGERGPVRGLSRLLRRNPTDAERHFWDALTQRPALRRQGLQAAGAGRRRTSPTSCRFRCALVIDLVPAGGERSAPQGAREQHRVALRARLPRGGDFDALRSETDRRQSARSACSEHARL